jgi:hypothetical protein
MPATSAGMMIQADVARAAQRLPAALIGSLRDSIQSRQMA